MMLERNLVSRHLAFRLIPLNQRAARFLVPSFFIPQQGIFLL